jgi:2'-5' RNA ligase
MPLPAPLNVFETRFTDTTAPGDYRFDANPELSSVRSLLAQRYNAAAPYLIQPDLNEEEYAVPHHLTFSAVWNWHLKYYYTYYDESQIDSIANSMAMRRDGFIQELLWHRQLPTVSLSHALECEDPDDPGQVEVRRRLERIIRRIPFFQRMKLQLMESLFYGRSGSQVVWGKRQIGGDTYTTVVDHQPVNGDKIPYAWDRTPGIFIYKGSDIFDDPRAREHIQFLDRGPALWLRDPYYQDRFIIHEFQPTDTDYLFEPEKAASVHGVGFRDRFYWTWNMRAQVLDWYLNAIERVGANGMLYGYYTSGNVSDRKATLQALKDLISTNVAAFPRKPGDVNPMIDRIEASPVGYDVMYQLIVHLEDIMRRGFLGQNLSSKSAPTGLGSGVADLQAESKESYVLFDAACLEETLDRHLIGRIIRLNSWAYNGRRYRGEDLPFSIRFTIQADRQNVGELIQAAQALWQMGVPLDMESLRDRVGLIAPRSRATTLVQMGGATGMTPNVQAVEADAGKGAFSQIQDRHQHPSPFLGGPGNVTQEGPPDQGPPNGPGRPQNGSAEGFARHTRSRRSSRHRAFLDLLANVEAEYLPAAFWDPQRRRAWVQVSLHTPVHKITSVRNGLDHILGPGKYRVTARPPKGRRWFAVDLGKLRRLDPAKPEWFAADEPEQSPAAPPPPSFGPSRTTTAPAAAPKPPAEMIVNIPRFGQTRTRMIDATGGRSPRQVREAAEGIFHPAAVGAMSDRDIHRTLATLAGASDAADVEIHHMHPVNYAYDGPGGLPEMTGHGIAVSNKEYAPGADPSTDNHLWESKRMIYPTAEGPVIRNVLFKSGRDAFGNRLAPPKIGLEIFGRQVEEALRHGFRKLETRAARDNNPLDPYYGYNIWPKYGYDAPLTGHYKGLLASDAGTGQIPAELADAKNVSDLMGTKEGRDWWQKNGDTIDMEFDLRPGSRHLKRWHEYLERHTKEGWKPRNVSPMTTEQSSTAFGTTSTPEDAKNLIRWAATRDPHIWGHWPTQEGVRNAYETHHAALDDETKAIAERLFARFGIPLGGEHFARLDEPPAPPSLGRPRRVVAAGFASPEKASGLNFRQALSHFNSPTQGAWVNKTHEVDNAHRIPHATISAMGDWAPSGEPPGAEPSTFTEYHNIRDYDQLKHVMSVKGLLGEQLSVIPFIVRKNGPHSLYSMRVPDDPESTRKVLDAHGLPYRTLDINPPGGGTRVIVYDQFGDSAEGINKLAHHYGVNFDVHKGFGEFFPQLEDPNSRDEAAGKFREFIKGYRQQHAGEPWWNGDPAWRPAVAGDRPYRGGPEDWDLGIRDHGGSTAPEVHSARGLIEFFARPLGGQPSGAPPAPIAWGGHAYDVAPRAPSPAKPDASSLRAVAHADLPGSPAPKIRPVTTTETPPLSSGLSPEHHPAVAAATEGVTKPRPKTDIRELVRRIGDAPMLSSEAATAIIASQDPGNPRPPEHIEDVARFMQGRLAKLQNGRMSDRDTAKGYLTTVASQGAREIGLSTLKERLGKDAPFVRWLEDTDEGRFYQEHLPVKGPFRMSDPIRAEDAVSSWFVSPNGRKALDNLEANNFNHDDWLEMFKIRKAWGDDRFGTFNVTGKQLGVPPTHPDYGRTDVPQWDYAGGYSAGRRKPKIDEKTGLQKLGHPQVTPDLVKDAVFRDADNVEGPSWKLQRIYEMTDALNASKGDPEKFDHILKSFAGIAEGKLGYVKHFFGFPDRTTVDSAQSNFWLTGHGDTRRLERDEAVDLARAIQTHQKDRRVKAAIVDRVMRQMKDLQGHLEKTYGLSITQHMLHHWLWEAAKNSVVTHLAQYMGNAANYDREDGPELLAEEHPLGGAPAPITWGGTAHDEPEPPEAPAKPRIITPSAPRIIIPTVANPRKFTATQEMIHPLGRGYLNDRDLGVFRSKTGVGNFNDYLTHRNVEHNVRMLTSFAQAGESARGQYEGAAHALHDMLGRHDAIHWAALNAVLSPQTEYGAHTLGATRLMRMWTDAGRPRDDEGVNNVIDRFVSYGRPEGDPEGRHLGRQAYWAWERGGFKEKKVRELLKKHAHEITEDDIGPAHSSVKTRDFFLAALGHPTSPTDVHMGKFPFAQLTAPGGKIITDDDLRNMIGHGGKDYIKQVKAGQEALLGDPAFHKAFKVWTSRAAERLGWPVHETQEAAWATLLAAHVLKTRDNPLTGRRFTPDEIIDNLTHTTVGSAWHPATLFGSKEFQDEFRRIGVPEGTLQAVGQRVRERFPERTDPERVRVTDRPAFLHALERIQPAGAASGPDLRIVLPSGQQISRYFLEDALELLARNDADPGVMIALKVPASVAADLALPGGEDAADLHVTLAYLGRKSSLSPDSIKVAREVVGLMAEAYPALTAKLAGCGRFSASESSDGQDVIYLSVDSADLCEFRAELVDMLDVAKVPYKKNHGYTPHVTLKYVDTSKSHKTDHFEPVHLTFDSVSFYEGGGAKDFRFGGRY